MKQITAIVKPFKLEEVREALAEIGAPGGPMDALDDLADLALDLQVEALVPPRIGAGAGDLCGADGGGGADTRSCSCGGGGFRGFCSPSWPR